MGLPPVKRNHRKFWYNKTGVERDHNVSVFDTIPRQVKIDTAGRQKIEVIFAKIEVCKLSQLCYPVLIEKATETDTTQRLGKGQGDFLASFPFSGHISRLQAGLCNGGFCQAP